MQVYKKNNQLFPHICRSRKAPEGLIVDMGFEQVQQRKERQVHHLLLYIIRHGETNLNHEGRLQGWVDEPLNENGRKLAEVTGEALKDIPFDLVISSPLSRALETGILAVKASGEKQGRKIPVITDDRLKEINWGSWDFMGIVPENYSLPISRAEYGKLHSDTFHFTWPDDGETVWDVIRRTGDFYQELIHNPDYQDKTILISTHGFALRAMLNPLYENRDDFWHGQVPYNCAVNILEIAEGKSHFLEEDVIYYDRSLCFNPYALIDEEPDKKKTDEGEPDQKNTKEARPDEEITEEVTPDQKDKDEGKTDTAGTDQGKGGEAGMKLLFVEYPKCTTCRKARKWLTDHAIDFEDRHIVEENPTKEEIAAWHEKSGLPLKRFFNTSGQVYRNNNIKDRLKDMSEEEQYALLASDGMLVKRPVIVTDDFVLVGFKEKEYEEKLL